MQTIFQSNNSRMGRGMLAFLMLGLMLGLTLSMCMTTAWAQEAPARRADNDRRPTAGDQKAGSVLVYNLYTSQAGNTGAEETRLSFTNTNTREAATLHLFFVDGASCAIGDMYLCLTPSQTTVLLASDIDPGVTGYVIAVASDKQGCPISFNHLIGNALVKWASGHAASLSAEAYQAFFNGRLPGWSTGDTRAVLDLDGRRYDQVATQLAAPNIPSAVDGNQTLLVINSLSGNAITRVDPLLSLFGILYDDSENAFSFALNPPQCQFRAILQNGVPRTQPSFTNAVSAGRTGWLKLLTVTPERGLTGAVIYFHPQSATRVGVFSGGQNLHHLERSSASLTIPVFPADC